MTEEQVTSEHAPRREYLITRGVLPLVIEATEGRDISAFLDDVRMLIESRLFVQGALPFADSLSPHMPILRLLSRPFLHNYWITTLDQPLAPIWAARSTPRRSTLPIKASLCITRWLIRSIGQ